MHPTVSVIIPVYNGERFIALAINSALQQSHRPLEIIVVNDGSTDATLAVLQRYGQRIRLISTANGGVAQARNVGMQASHGELIAFLDADDRWHPHKLQIQVAAMRAYPQPGLCCCDYLVLNKWRGHVVNHFSACPKHMTVDRPFDHGLLLTLIGCNVVGTASTVLIRRSLMQRVGLFNVAYRQAEDYDYWLRCATFSAFLVLSARLMEKISHDSNLTNDQLETLLCHERVLLEHRTRGELGRAEQACLAPALATLRRDISLLLFERGRYRDAVRSCWRALRSQPAWRNGAQVATLLIRKTLAAAWRSSSRLPGPFFHHK